MESFLSSIIIYAMKQRASFAKNVIRFSDVNGAFSWKSCMCNCIYRWVNPEGNIRIQIFDMKFSELASPLLVG